jgi:uncharacterized protein YndB with AHSA1/START domain
MWEYEYSVETAASPAAVWRHWSDMTAWPAWNAGIEKIEIDGPFEVGTTFTMTPPGDDSLTMRLTEIVPGELFTDEMDAGDFVVRTVHRLAPMTAGATASGATEPGSRQSGSRQSGSRESGTRITYRTEITGPSADQVGPELGPAITADFPDVLAALAKIAQDSAA